MTAKTKKAFCESHPNIALIKYWGKSNEEKNTPINGSLSVTLDFGTTKTEVSYSNNSECEFFLNGEQQTLTRRLQTAIDFFGNLSNGMDNSQREHTNFRISSTNNFPTAAGFASSAAGASAFVGALAGFIGNTEEPISFWSERNINLSRIARQVSGSGCRSIYGGFVEWQPGTDETSISQQVFNENYWDNFVAISISLHTKPKKIPSTQGMQHTVKTCPWAMWRANEIVPKRINDAKDFIAKKDFNSLAEIIMKESNELHANCAASYPPFYYLKDESRDVIEAIHQLNKKKGRNIAAYSFDAGPNPFIFTEKENLSEVIQMIKSLDLSIEHMTEAKPSSGIRTTIVE